MSNSVISVEGLSKRYRLGRRFRPRNFGEAIVNSLKSPFKRKASHGETETDDFWALKDVNFEVQRGEVVGIIGRNGAGKSTLLKILSHITPPTSGQITLHGRVASLLEVGTGFHPELTGRENIFLNGAMLGMQRTEIGRKFDEIVAFSEVEQFLDTPVKRYSSGMYVRLAFAVAAHLEPEILVVDEVLAVGDAAFQKKCLGKMRNVSTQTGRTVLFVSHQMSAVSTLCNRCVLLKNGKLDFCGNVSTAISKYLVQASDIMKSAVDEKSAPLKIKGIRITQGEFICGDDVVVAGKKTVFEVDIEVRESMEKIVPGINFSGDAAGRVATLWHGFRSAGFSFGTGKFTLKCTIPSMDLVPGEYWVSITFGGRDGQSISELENVKRLHVREFAEGETSNGQRSPRAEEHGVWLPEFEWALDH